MTRLHLRVRTGPPPRPGGRAGAVWRRADGSIEGRAFLDPGVCWLEWDSAGLFRFQPGGDAVDVWPIATASEASVRALFDREIGAIIFQALGRGEAMHASAAAGPAGAVIVCGLSGAGKSTCAFALARLPQWSHLADDQVLLMFDASQPAVVTRPFVPSLRPESRAHFGVEAVSVIDDAAPPLVPIAGIVVLEQVSACAGPWAITRVTAAEAFIAILPHAHCFAVQDANAAAGFANRYLRLIDTVPVHRVVYRPAFAQLAALTGAIASLISTGAPAPRL